MSELSGLWLQCFSRLLEPPEREAVLGDLLEAGEDGWHAVSAVAGLCVRRQVQMWQNWRPWLAAFGLAVPGSFMLMGFSLSVSHGYAQWISPGVLRLTGANFGPGLALLACNVLLLCGWAWTGAFLLGSLSRRTLWVSAIFSFAPCLFCLERFRIESLSRFSLLLFLPPALWGVLHSLRIARIPFSSAFLLASSLTLLTMPTWSTHGPWIPNWALSWPAWYLVATSEKPAWLLERVKPWRTR